MKTLLFITSNLIYVFTIWFMDKLSIEITFFLYTLYEYIFKNKIFIPYNQFVLLILTFFLWYNMSDKFNCRWTIIIIKLSIWFGENILKTNYRVSLQL